MQSERGLNRVTNSRTNSVPQCGLQTWEPATPDLPVALRSETGIPYPVWQSFLGAWLSASLTFHSQRQRLVRAVRAQQDSSMARAQVPHSQGAQARQQPQGDLPRRALELLFPGAKDRKVILISPTHMYLQVGSLEIFLPPSLWPKDVPDSPLLQAQDSPSPHWVRRSLAPVLSQDLPGQHHVPLGLRSATLTLPPWCSLSASGDPLLQNGVTLPQDIHGLHRNLFFLFGV